MMPVDPPALAPIDRAAVLGELVRFACVGTLGLLVDSTVLYAGLGIGLGLYLGRLVSYLVSSSCSWLFNRRFTFRCALPPSAGEWLRYIAANALGGMINLAIYAVLVSRFMVFAAYPALAVAVGAVAGMLINFTLSRHAVFGR